MYNKYRSHGLISYTMGWNTVYNNVLYRGDLYISTKLSTAIRQNLPNNCTTY